MWTVDKLVETHPPCYTAKQLQEIANCSLRVPGLVAVRLKIEKETNGQWRFSPKQAVKILNTIQPKRGRPKSKKEE